MRHQNQCTKMSGQIVNEIFAPSYQSMKVINIDLVVLIKLHSCI